MEASALRASQIAQREDAVSGTVRIGSPDGFGTGFLVSHIAELTQRHPLLNVELVPVPRSFSLSKREADIAITLERPAEGRLVARKLIDYKLGLYASRRYLDAKGMPKSLDDLASHVLVGYVEDLLFSKSLDYASDFWPAWKTQVAVSSAIGQTEAVRSGAGIGILHCFIARGFADLIPVLELHSLTRTYWAAVHQDLREVRRIRVVSDFLVEIVRNRASLFA
jgi:DNA-binding transcriptional LysR family regulator